MKARATASAAALFVASVFALPTSGIADSTISPSDVQQGIAISPIPFDKLNLKNRPRAMVALGSYLVNGVGDCVGCHTFPRFLRPGGTSAGTPPGNFTHNLTSLGSDPTSGNPFLDTVPTTPDGFEPLNGQMKANVNADTTHGSVSYTTPGGVPIYPKNHFLAGGRCFAFFMSRNLTPDDTGKPRGLSEAEFIQVMRTGKDISCDPSRVPTYGGAPDPVCSIPEPPAAVLPSFNPEVLQAMPWPTYHSMTDTELKAVYAYLSSLPQATACNAAANGCAGLPGSDPRIASLTAGANRYVYSNTDDCPNNVNPAGGNTVGSAPPQ